MKKLVNGIVEFRKKDRTSYQEMFSHLAFGQSPDTLFFACSDSRVVPSIFASTDPGDLFIVRNVGNLVPCCDLSGVSHSDESEAAAIEFAIETLKVTHVIICGHSECGAMHAILDGRKNLSSPNLREWLRHGDPSLMRVSTTETKEEQVNQLSKMNVLQQLEHLKTYPTVKDGLNSGRLKLHGWWFDLTKADVYAYEAEFEAFVLIDEAEGARIIARIDTK